MIKLKNILTKILEVICVIMFAFITIVGTYQIVTRYVFNAPSTCLLYTSPSPRD